MAYHRQSMLISRRGHVALGASDGISVPAVVTRDAVLYQSDYVYPAASATGTSDKPASQRIGMVKKGTAVTITAVHGIMTKLASGGWVHNNPAHQDETVLAIRSQPRGSSSTSTPSSAPSGGGVMDKLFDFAKGAGGTLLSSGKAAPPGAVAPSGGGGGGLLTPRNMMIGAGGVVLLALLLRRNH